MNETLKRALSGTVYVFVMWFGSSSKLSTIILFSIITLISTYEMWKLRKGKTMLFHFFYVWMLMLSIDLDSKTLRFIYILTWTFDTFAYLFGIRFGKHKIMPSVSPKKSWEGFIGGLVSTIVASLILFQLNLFEKEQVSLFLLIGIGIILPFTASIGDFLESYFKRQAGVKDSGSLIPGHGGILDRMDAFMITIPIIYILTNLFK
ncbi:MAG: hypothetical protein CMD02_02100 [Flavobacteriales bacterium]|nr:hypothetical protein [Flavobacteriales bacterium]|tara:strand:- start:323 stop:937 length:615 start_codon:yes stop_codon:yes gene_type:complete